MQLYYMPSTGLTRNLHAGVDGSHVFNSRGRVAAIDEVRLGVLRLPVDDSYAQPQPLGEGLRPTAATSHMTLTGIS